MLIETIISVTYQVTENKKSNQTTNRTNKMLENNPRLFIHYLLSQAYFF